MTEDLREHIAHANLFAQPEPPSASAELADDAECPSTRLSYYENTIVKCHLTGPHNRCEGVDHGELRQW